MGGRRSRLWWAPAATIAGALVAAACGSFGSENDAPPAANDGGNPDDAALPEGGDASPEGATRSDAVAPVAKCDATRPFGSLLVFPATSQLQSARLGVDNRLYVSRTLGDLGTTMFTDGGVDTVAPILAPATADQQAMLSPDDKFLVFHSQRGTAGVSRLFYSQRAPLNGDLLTPALFVFDVAIPATEELQSPWLTTSQHVYFTHAQSAGATKQIQFGKLAAPPMITGVQNVFDQQTPDVDHPLVSSDELELFYVTGGTVHRSVRRSASDRFPLGSPVAELSSVVAPTPTWMSADDCDLYLLGVSSGVARLHRYSRR